MKELTKKILESGLVDKATAMLMEKWGQLEEGASDLVDQNKIVGRLEQLTTHNEKFVRKTLEDFVEEIELLLQPEAIERKEIQLDPLIAEVFDPTKGH